VRALVDSGAVRPIFPLSVATEAGIDLSKSVHYPIQYGGSTTPGWIARARIDLDIGPVGRILDLSIVFVEKLDLPYALLGRIGFFDQFNEVSFMQRISPPQFRLNW
jgi:predicted aspartyl protease